MKTYVYSAAGGNPTALNFGIGIGRKGYSDINNNLQKSYPEIEQVGFYEEQAGLPRLQMAGGEFCGNATRSFACLLSDLNPGKSDFTFHVSGFPGLVEAQVSLLKDKFYECRVVFKSFEYSVEERELDGGTAQVVDLGGIIHIVVKEVDRPFNEKDYEKELKRIKDQLNIDGDAVGVLWIKEEGRKIFMKPVVWVKEIDTCYYETSCGSGSIAVGLVKVGKNGEIDVVQPSGKTINVKINGSTLTLFSEMEKIIELEGK